MVGKGNLEMHTGAKIQILNSNHILKTTIFTKFTFFNPQILSNFWIKKVGFCPSVHFQIAFSNHQVQSLGLTDASVHNWEVFECFSPYSIMSAGRSSRFINKNQPRLSWTLMSAPRNIQIVWTRAARIRHALNQDFGGQWEKKFLKMKLFLPLAFLDLQDRHSHNVWHLFFLQQWSLVKDKVCKGHHL